MTLKVAEVYGGPTPDQSVEFRGTELTPTMARTLMRARAYDGKSWTVYGPIQTLKALARRGMLYYSSYGVGTLTPQGVAFFSHLIDRAGTGR